MKETPLPGKLTLFLGCRAGGRHYRPRDQQPQRARRSPPKALGPAARRPRAGPRSLGRGHGRSAGRHQRVAGAGTTRGRSRSAGNAHRPRGGSRWSLSCAATSARPPRSWASGRPAWRSASPSTPRRRRSRWHADDAGGARGGGGGRWRWRNRGARTTRWIKCRKPSTGCAPW